MEDNGNIKIITLADLWWIFVHHLWIILLAVIIAVGGVYATINFSFVPRYKSTATLYILQQNNTNNNKNEYEEFNLALKIVNDCTHLLRSHSVLDTVINELGLDISYEELYNSITVHNPEETRILEVRVESDSPYKAKEIVDRVCIIGTNKIAEAMGFEQVNFYEQGILDVNPCNRTSLLTYLIIGFVVAVLVYSIFLVSYLLDDRIQTDEDIENYLKLSVLGDIPNANLPTKKRYGYKYRSKYYRRNAYRYGYGEEHKHE